MNQIPAAMDRHLEVIQCHQASSLTGRYWYGSLWYYQNPEQAPDVEKCTAGVQLEAGLSDACFVDINRVLVGMDTGSVALWELTDDYRTFIQQYSSTEHDNIVSSVCMCQDKKNVISASHDCSVKIWDLETFTSLHTYKAHGDIIHCVQSHPSHPNVFITASQDGSVCMWDTRKEKPASKLDKSPLKSLPSSVAWQPGVDHSYGIGSDDGQLVVKDTRAAVTEFASAFVHHRGITRLQFSLDKWLLIHRKSRVMQKFCEDYSKEWKFIAKSKMSEYHARYSVCDTDIKIEPGGCVLQSPPLKSTPSVSSFGRKIYRPTLVTTVSEDCTAIVTDVACQPMKSIYRSTAHQDFIRGLSWSTGDKFYTCGWDAKVVTHTVANISSSCELNAESVKMEVNGDQLENDTKVIEHKVVEKIVLNGQHKMDSVLEPESYS